MALIRSIQSPRTYIGLAAAATTMTLVTAGWLSAARVAPRDPCALPAGAGELDAPAQTVLARHAMACRDFEHGRITRAEYLAAIAVEPPPPAPQWASSVRGFSSEYTTSSWSAMQALGAPDVFPRSGDDARAWASKDEDAGVESIEVGFAQPQRASAVQVYETLNPGAVTHVELVTESGARIVVQRSQLAPSGGAAVSTFSTRCTRERIVAARVVVASHNVAGWNEIDAVAVLPCPPP